MWEGGMLLSPRLTCDFLQENNVRILLENARHATGKIVRRRAINPTTDVKRHNLQLRS